MPTSLTWGPLPITHLPLNREFWVLRDTQRKRWSRSPEQVIWLDI